MEDGTLRVGALARDSGVERASGREVDPVFYHFHYVRIYAEGMIDFGDFVLSRSVKELFYRPYLARLAEAKRAIMSVGAGIAFSYDAALYTFQGLAFWAEDRYEVVVTSTITATVDEQVMFLCEVAQAGIFLIKDYADAELDEMTTCLAEDCATIGDCLDALTCPK